MNDIDTSGLKGKLEFIRDVECTTSAEKQAINEAIAVIEEREKWRNEIGFTINIENTEEVKAQIDEIMAKTQAAIDLVTELAKLGAMNGYCPHCGAKMDESEER